MLEYAIGLALIAVVCIGALRYLGTASANELNRSGEYFEAPEGPPSLVAMGAQGEG